MKFLPILVSIVVLGSLLLTACGDGGGNKQPERSMPIEEKAPEEIEPRRTVIDDGKTSRADFQRSMKAEIKKTKDRLDEVEKILAKTDLPAAKRDVYLAEVERLKLRIPKLEEILARADTLGTNAFKSEESERKN